MKWSYNTVLNTRKGETIPTKTEGLPIVNIGSATLAVVDIDGQEAED